MHTVVADDAGTPAFFFHYRDDALNYMDIYDQRAENFQRRDNLLNHLDADFGIPKEDEPGWDVWFDNLDDEEAPFVDYTLEDKILVEEESLS